MRPWAKVLGAVATVIVTSAALPPGVSSAAANTPWVNVISGPGTDLARDVALDSGGSSYVVGSFEQSVTFGPAPADTLTAHGEEDVYLAKYDAGGAFRWVRQIGSTLDDRAAGVLVLPSGRVVVTGTGWNGTIVGVGPAAVTVPAAGATDAFLATFTLAGDLVWASSQGGTGFDDAAAITSDEWGRIAITGSFTKTATFGASTVLPGGSVQPGANPVSMTAKALQDAYAASFDSTGQLRWAKDTAAGGSQDLGETILATGGTMIVAGTFSGSATIGTTQVFAANINAGAAYIASLANADGSVLWIRLLRGASGTSATPADLVTTPSGDVVLVGSVRGPVDFVEPGHPKQTTINTGATTSTVSMYILRFGPGGNHRWAAIGSSTVSVSAVGVSVDSTGELHVAGTCEGTVSWFSADGTPRGGYVPLAGRDGFLIDYAPVGIALNNHPVRGSGNETVDGIATDGDGNGRIVGNFSAGATFPVGPTVSSSTVDGYVARVNDA
jgi:hypothetical protein